MEGVRSGSGKAIGQDQTESTLVCEPVHEIPRDTKGSSLQLLVKFGA